MAYPVLFDPLFDGTFYSGAGFLAGINANSDCVYYTNINQDNKTLELVECLPGAYNRVVLISYATLAPYDPDDDMDYSDTASYRLASFLNGRRACKQVGKTVETGILSYSRLAERIAKDKGLSSLKIVKFTHKAGIKMRVSIIINSDFLSEGDEPQESITDAINVAMAFRFDPIDEKQEGKEHE